jgi:hypothetical protein
MSQLSKKHTSTQLEIDKSTNLAQEQRSLSMTENQTKALAENNRLKNLFIYY